MNKKNLFKFGAVLLVLSIAVLCFVSCSSEEMIPAGMKKISSDVVEYNFYVPSVWNADISTGIVSAYYSSNDMSNVNMSSFDLEENDTTVSEYWTYYKEAIAKTFTNIEYLNEGETMLIDGNAAAKYIYKADVSGNSYQFMQVLTIFEGKVYIFTYTSTPDVYETHIEDVNKMLEHLTFGE